MARSLSRRCRTCCPTRTSRGQARTARRYPRMATNATPSPNHAIPAPPDAGSAIAHPPPFGAAPLVVANPSLSASGASEASGSREGAASAVAPESCFVGSASGAASAAGGSATVSAPYRIAVNASPSYAMSMLRSVDRDGARELVRVRRRRAAPRLLHEHRFGAGGDPFLEQHDVAAAISIRRVAGRSSLA